MLFYYSARAYDGSTHAGSMEAESEGDALSHLRSRKLVVTALEEKSQLRVAFSGLTRLLRGRRTEATFFRALATLVGAGVPVQRALYAIVEECADGGFAETLRAIAADVDRGDSICSAFDRHPEEFSRLSRAMLRAGEARGEIDRALVDIADVEERNRALRRRVVAALSYPAVVSVCAVGLVGFLLATTMPAFASMFSQMRVPLPASTRALIAVGKLLSEPSTWLLGAALGIGGSAAVTSLLRSESVASVAIDRARLSLPLIGAIARKGAITRFSRTLGALLRGGVDAVAALELAADVSGSLALRKEFGALGESLRRGDTLLQAFEACSTFDAGFLQLVRAGEESGTLDAMLLHVAAAYQADVETAIGALGAAIEPALICILGIVIGSIVASIIVPLYSLIGSIR